MGVGDALKNSSKLSVSLAFQIWLEVPKHYPLYAEPNQILGNSFGSFIGHL